MRHIATAIRCLGMLVLGAIILCIMGLCNLFCGAPPVPAPMRIVGWNCNDLIYEDAQGWTYEKGRDGRFVPFGRIDYKGARQ